ACAPARTRLSRGRSVPRWNCWLRPLALTCGTRRRPWRRWVATEVPAVVGSPVRLRLPLLTRGAHLRTATPRFRTPVFRRKHDRKQRVGGGLPHGGSRPAGRQGELRSSGGVSAAVLLGRRGRLR